MLFILPIHLKYTGKYGIPGWDAEDHDDNCTDYYCEWDDDDGKNKIVSDPAYLWIYVIFTYIFSGLAVYLLLQETNKIIRARQKYLGSQTSTTDRTIRLSGIPRAMRSEETLKNFLESLQVGKVESVTLCRDWRELDDLIDKRFRNLRRLEIVWTKLLGYKNRLGDGNTLPLTRQQPCVADILSEESEQARLIPELENREEQRVADIGRPRPKKRLWYGPLNLRFRTVDAIDYYEEKLRRLDEEIVAVREKEYPPAEVAFVTMESIAASQTLVQTIISPHPAQLLARLAPAPADVVWRNTYLPRSRRMAQAWLITGVIGFLTVFWSMLLVPVAYLLELETLHKVFPRLADALSRQPLAKSLVQTGLPTLTLSLMTVAVPYLYNCGFPLSLDFLSCFIEIVSSMLTSDRAFKSARYGLSG